MPKTVVISFGTDRYAGALEALRHSALGVGQADEFRAFRESDVTGFFARHHAHLTESRGYGWWAWKPHIIKETLDGLADGDVVVYCDSTMMFEQPVTAALDLAAAPVILARLGGWTKNDYSNARWTKKATFAAMGIDDPSVGEDVQLNAAFQVYRNGPVARAFVDEYLRWCLDLDVVNDVGKDLPGVDGGAVVDHRHDQSVLSLLAARSSCVAVVPDVTQHGQDDADRAGRRPIVFHHHRTPRLPKIAVITATTGGEFLRECIASVQRTTLPNVEHWIVTDGEEHRADVEAVLGEFEHRMPIVHMVLPRNVGSGGWCGHRVYGSVPWLVDADYVCFLDDDNTVDPDHYHDLAAACIERDAKWAHSLRRIVDRSGAPVCPDNCESLGGIAHTVNGRGDYLVDTSCYMIERDLAVATSPAWNARFRDPSGRRNADRELCQTLLASAPVAVVRKHSVAYRVGSTAASVTADFFRAGNAAYGYDFARCKDLYVFHFSARATADLLAARRDCRVSHALDEWQMTLLRGLDGARRGGGGYNLIDGFSNAPNIPHGATVLVTLCNPGDLPLDFFASRADLKKLVYTLESPNVRHKDQWDVAWLAKHFDVALTYWRPLLDDPRLRTVFAPHNTHHGDLDDPLDREALLRDNRGEGRSCAMVLERRPALFDSPDYIVNGVSLRCQDKLREDLVVGLRDVTVFGVGWREVADGDRIKLGHDMHRSKDPRHTVDILQDFTFAVISENCDAEGNVSEKIYDALSAGCIPLYYGNVPPQLDIPEGPDSGVHIDLRARGLDTGAKVQAFIDGLGDECIAAMKRRVVDLREGILRRVGTAAFAAAVEEAVELMDRQMTPPAAKHVPK